MFNYITYIFVYYKNNNMTEIDLTRWIYYSRGVVYIHNISLVFVCNRFM